MDSEAITYRHKPNRRRIRIPDPCELLEQLDAVDLRLLQWLLRYPFERAEDLALATGSSIATVYRHLNVLHENDLVERVIPASLGTAKCWVYHLSNPGLLALAFYEQADPAVLARSWRTDERGLLRLLPRVVSLITLQECINGLVAHAPEALALQGRRSEIRWHWVRDFAHRFTYREKLIHCRADAVLLLRVRTMAENTTSTQEQWYSLFVLLDVEIVSDTWLKQRLGRILYYRESVERWAFYQHFPPVLVLVPTPRRMEHWQWSVREAATGLRVAQLSGAIACLPQKQQRASYNPWSFGWKTLGTNVPCALRDLLHPLPIEAIPPDLMHHHANVHVMQEESRIDEGRATTTTFPMRKRTRIIVGTFVDRARAIQKDRRSDTHDEREIIALLGLGLGQRHIELLTLLFMHPLLHVCEIAALLGQASSSVERYLGQLRSQGCIESLALDVGQRWQLSERGLRLIAATLHISAHSIATGEENDGVVYLVQRGVDVLHRHLEHTTGIYGFFASLSQAASLERLHGHRHDLLWWETGVTCERRYRDHERWNNLRPDAMGEYQAGERRVRFWLEWDRGTMSSRDLAVKLTTYAQYVGSREWFKQEVTLPLLLVVTPEPGQERRLCRVVTTTLTDRCGLTIRTTTLTRVREQGILGPIWNQVLPHGEGTNLIPRCTFYR